MAGALTIWLYILFRVQPVAGDWLVLIAFFLSLFVWLSSAIAYALYIFKVKKSNREVIFAHRTSSIRQGAIITSTLIIIMILRMLDVSATWDIVLVVLLALAVEAVFRYFQWQKTS
jgi:hypothetical protein